MAKAITESVIWKYHLHLRKNELELPKGARVVAVHENLGAAAIWALVVPERPVERRTFYVVGTGWLLDESTIGAEYLGSAHIPSDGGTFTPPGGFVWHVLEIFPDPTCEPG